ncbi:MAG: PolC-type DNA polymerase III [Syntrophomonadaceae bacterium]|nr:PolC-type DNA polymerase III [Syntrophomonadaceae bacterium]
MIRTGPESREEARDLSHWLDNLSLPAAALGVLKEAQIEQVEVDRAKQTWIIHILLNGPVDVGCLQKISAIWQGQVSGLRKVEWKVRYHYGPLRAPEVLRENWSSYVTQIIEANPYLRGWLEASTIQLADTDRLCILLSSPMAVQWLEGKGARKLLAEWLEHNLAWCPQITWKTTASALTPVEEEPLVMQRGFNAVTEQGSEASRSNGGIKEKKATSGAVWLGKKINTPPLPLNQLIDEEKSVTVQGRVFDLSIRELRSHRTLIIFNLTDNKDSITVKIFVEKKEREKLLEHLNDGVWIIVRGAAQVDRYSQELTLLAQDINAGVAPIRKDEAPRKRVEMHLHTKMSSMDGLVEIKALMERVASWGHPAVAITDHGVVQSFPEAYEWGRKYGIKVIYGVEGYLTEELSAAESKKKKVRQRTYHIIILARNQTGLYNLYRLISNSHLHNFYRHPRIARQEIQRYREGLILGTACEAGELMQALLRKDSPENVEEIASFYDFIEIQPLCNNEFLMRNGQLESMDDLRKINRTLVELGAKLGKPVVGTGDVHFLDPEDEHFRRILQTGKGFEDAELQAPLYLRTTEEMLEEFSYLGEDIARQVVIDNPLHICSQIEEVRPVPEDLHAPVIDGAESQVTEMTYQRARELYGDPLPALVQDRIEKELNAIINNGFAVLYLIAHKLVRKSNEDGYLVGSRGSVGSSLVATLTGITEVNPLSPHYLCPKCHYNEFITDGSVGCGADLPERNCPQCQTPLNKDGHEIPFETFMGFKGDKVPDIDLNFSGEYQARAHRYVEELFGREHVFRAGTIATIAERTAYGFVKKYLDEHKVRAREAEIARLVKGCTGVKRTTGQHPGGLMVVPKGNDIYQFSPVQRPADDAKSETVTTHFDYEAISSQLVKLDILGHDDPTVIRMLQDLTGIDPRQIPMGEPQTMQLFSSVKPLGVTPEQIRSEVGTYGIPEFGTRFVRQMLEDTRPQTFSDLVRISGFSHGTDVWLNNAQELIKSGRVKLSEAISTRDDIMTYLIQQDLEPSLAFKIMEDVRKGKGVKSEFEEKMRGQQIPDWYIGSCKRIKYMFPKAHAVAYVTMAFRIAYFKLNYPEAFYASFFTVRADEFDAQLIVGSSAKVQGKIEELEQKGNEATAKEKSLLAILEVALEMYERKLKFRNVDLEKSDAYRFIITPQGLLPPLVALQGLGQTAAASIVEAREKQFFTSVEDLHSRTRVSKNIIEVMREHGCFNGLPESDQLSLF